ncbi:MAG TPA: TetR/AcrR family transcriptional regulator C-terminal domain-containing protein [Chloroflexota bacterium]|jgi:AcrR family transcriptional regulator
MATRSRPKATYHAGLTRDHVFRAAVHLADESGIAAVSMRKLAQPLGVEAMSLYHHVADKDDLLDGMVDVVVSEINARVAETSVPPGGTESDWKTAVRWRILTAREVLLGHPWAPGVIESRATMSPTVMRYYDSLIRVLREGGISVSLVHHAMHALGSRALGFTQELFAPDDAADSSTGMDVAAIIRGQLADEFPYITEVAVIESSKHDADSTLGWCDDQVEFEFGLDLLLDGLEKLHTTTGGRA